jgi:hypothetical protein
VRGLSAGDGKNLGFKQTQLHEDAGLVSVDVLVDKLVTLKLHDREHRNLDTPPGGLDPPQHPIDVWCG